MKTKSLLTMATAEHPQEQDAHAAHDARHRDRRRRGDRDGRRRQRRADADRGADQEPRHEPDHRDAGEHGCRAARARARRRSIASPSTMRTSSRAMRRCSRRVSPVIVTRTAGDHGEGQLAHGDQRRVDGLSHDPRLGRDERRSLHRCRRDARSGRWRVLGATVVKNLFPDTDPVGSADPDRPRAVHGGRRVGREGAERRAASGSGRRDPGAVHHGADRLSGNVRSVRSSRARMRRGHDRGAGGDSRRSCATSHQLGGAPDDFTVRNQTEIAQAATSTTRVMSGLLAAIASISLVVGGIGIMNIMLVSVTERTREIGIRMAIGARGSDVLTQFLVESVVMSLLGGVVGLAIGFGGAAILGHVTGWSTATPLIAVFDRGGILGGSGCVLRLLPGAQGGGARSDPGAQVRVGRNRRTDIRQLHNQHGWMLICRYSMANWRR